MVKLLPYRTITVTAYEDNVRLKPYTVHDSHIMLNSGINKYDHLTMGVYESLLT